MTHIGELATVKVVVGKVQIFVGEMGTDSYVLGDDGVRA